jgi:hypothetical protein
VGGEGPNPLRRLADVIRPMVEEQAFEDLEEVLRPE